MLVVIVVWVLVNMRDVVEVLGFFEGKFCILNFDLGVYKVYVIFLLYGLWKLVWRKEIMSGRKIIWLFYVLGMDGEEGLLGLLIV